MCIALNLFKHLKEAKIEVWSLLEDSIVEFNNVRN